MQKCLSKLELISFSYSGQPLSFKSALKSYWVQVRTIHTNKHFWTVTLLNGDLEYQKALHTFAVLGFPGCEIKPLKTLSNSKGWAGDGLSKCCWDQVETNPAPVATQWWPMSVAGLHTPKYFRTVNCKSCFKQEEFHWAFLMFKTHVCQDIWQPYICCYI